MDKQNKISKREKLIDEILDGVDINHVIYDLRHSEHLHHNLMMQKLKSILLLKNKPDMIEKVIALRNNVVKNLHLESTNNESAFNRVKMALKQEISRVEIERALVEYNQAYRQIVTNGVIKVGDDLVFLARQKAINDKRLVGTLGLIGGHMDIYDDSPECAFMRELHEEIEFKGLTHSSGNKELCVICINDSMDSVSNEHLGLIYFTELHADELTTKNPEEQVVRIPISEIKERGVMFYNFDQWAKIAIGEVLKQKFL